MQNIKKGFTLAEVLITLAIIGVVAALTIPTLVQSINSSKFISALKKNLLTLNSALLVNLANNNIDSTDTTIIDAADLANWFITGNSEGTGTSRNINTLKWSAGNVDVWLADSTRLIFVKTAGGSNGCSTITASSFDPAAAGVCYVFVDVNGDKKPNTVATAAIPADVYVLGISSNGVIPVVLTGNTVDLPTTNISGGILDPAYSHAHIDSGNNASYSAMTGAT